MRILRIDHHVAWLPQPNESQLILSSELPPKHLITSVFGLIFKGELLLLSKLVHRGWDLPGGHIEPDENPVSALHREIYEEAKVEIGHSKLVGCQKILLLGKKPPGYEYPFPVSYQLFFTAKVSGLKPFSASQEVLERDFFSRSQLQNIELAQQWLEIYEAALSLQI